MGKGTNHQEIKKGEITILTLTLYSIINRLWGNPLFTYDFMIFYRYNKNNKKDTGLYLTFGGQNKPWGKPVSLSRAMGLFNGFDTKLSPDEKYISFLNRNDGIYWMNSAGILKYKNSLSRKERE